MRTRHQISTKKTAFIGFIKAAATALLSVIIVLLLMNYAATLSYSAPSLSVKSNLTPADLNNSNDCSIKMDDALFQTKYQEIAGKYFEETRMSLSKELLDHYCLSSEQVRDLMTLFSYDRTRMDFASYAIVKVVDPENFMVCKGSFMISANGMVIEDLIKDHMASLAK
jgi:hypothetical protein